MSYDFTPEGFRAWLAAHDPEEIAGHTCTDHHSPERHFWNTVHGYGDDDTDGSLARSFMWERENTEWLHEFAHRIDGEYGNITNGVSHDTMIRPVTYGQSLWVIDKILPGTRDTLDLADIA